MTKPFAIQIGGQTNGRLAAILGDIVDVLPKPLIVLWPFDFDRTPLTFAKSSQECTRVCLPGGERSNSERALDRHAWTR